MSEISIDIYIAGTSDSDGSQLSLYLKNRSDWSVEASSALYVKHFLFSAFRPGFLHQRLSFGWDIPLVRCYNNDFLSHDGILTIQVWVGVVAEQFSRARVLKQLSTLKKTQE